MRKNQKSMKADLEKMQDTEVVYSEVMNDTDEQVEIWETLKENLENGETVYPPKAEGHKKRKAVRNEKPRRKQHRRSIGDSEDINNSDDSDLDAGSRSEADDNSSAANSGFP